MRRKKCISCEQLINPENLCYSDEGKPVCDTCYCEADPIATVVYSDNSGEHLSKDGDGTVDYVTEFNNPSPFKIDWKSSGGYRGYYEIVDSGSFVNVHEDCILSYSEDSLELKNFDEELEDYCRKHNIKFVKVFCMTSNLFSSGYDFFVPANDKDAVIDFVAELKRKHRDPVRFTETAMTGKDPAEITETDRDFVIGAGLIQNGATAEEAVKTVKTIRKMTELIKGVRP